MRTMINMNEIQQAVAILRSGGLVAFPTETVYGLGADANNAEAVAKVFAAKGRPHDHPLIVHIASVAHLSDWAAEVPETALKLAKAFWPGPLTMVFRKKAQVLSCVTGGQETVAIRVPAHEMASALLQAFGGGLVAPSANQFTHVSPTSAAAVNEELAGKVDLVLEGGECRVGVESTIVDMTSDVPVVLRPGMITVDQIQQVLGQPVLRLQPKSDIRVPGQHIVHYAPRTKTVVMASHVLHQMQGNVAFMVLSDFVSTNKVVKMSSSPDEYARELYRVLRELDKLGFEKIVVEAVPSGIAWDAIRDRLKKASGEA